MWLLFAIKMKLTISIVILAFASNFIWLVVCDADPAKKPKTSTKDTMSNTNSTLDLTNSTLPLKSDDDTKNSTMKIDGKAKNSTSTTPTSDLKAPPVKIDTKDKKTPLGDGKNAKNATMVEVGNAKAVHKPDLKLPSGKVIDPPKIDDKKTTTSKPSNDKMMTTTERAKTRKDMKPSGADIPPIQLPNATGPMGKFTTESPKNQRLIVPAMPGIVPPPNPFPVNPPAKVDEKSTKFPPSFIPNPIAKLPIGLIGEKLMPTPAATTTTTTEKAKLRKDLPGFNSSNDAVDDAWKTVKDKKYDDLDKKPLPKFEIPAKDLEELDIENGTATDHPAILKEAVAKEVKEAMDKFEEKHQKKDSEEDDSMAKWKIVALVLIPLFLVTFGIMLIIGIQQRMNVAKGRSVVYELTSDLGKKNNEKPVIST